MAYDLEEQEQLAQLKAFWAQYGNLITWVITITLACYAGYSFWQKSQVTKAQEASLLYDEAQKAAQAKDTAKMLRVASDMESRFGGTTFASMTALLAAKVSVEANDLKSAREHLEWAANKGADEELQVVAKIRLAGVLLDEKSYDAALKLLDGTFPPQFAGVVADRKGDILFAQNKLAEARAAYQLALEKTDQHSPGRQLIQLKLDALGAAAKAA